MIDLAHPEALKPWTADELVAAYDKEIDAVITIDFETYYDTEYSLTKLTNEAYVRDPRFQVIGVGVKINDQPAVWTDEAGFRKWARGVNWSRVAVLAHHAHFDGFILDHVFGIRPGFWLDTLSMARGLHGAGKLRLGLLAPKYGLGDKGDEVTRALGKRLEDFTPEEYVEYGRYCENDCELEWGLFLAMLNRGFPAVELLAIDTTIRKYTQPSLKLDQPLLEKALVDERKRKADLLARVGQEKGTFSSTEKFAALLKKFDVDPPTKLNPKGETIYAFAKSDPGMQDLLDHERDEVRWLAEARVSVKSTIAETRTERLLKIGQRGTVPIYLNYYGAHTGRWSGGDKMNPQNFQRGSPIRDSLEAPEDEELVVVDSAQIEARGVAWLADHTTLLDAFIRNDIKTKQFKEAFALRVKALGREASEDEAKRITAELAALGIEEGDFYSEVGSEIFGFKITKKTHPALRQLAKCMVLGLGYGMGWFKFAGELLKGMMGTPPKQFFQSDADTLGVSVPDFARDKKKHKRVAEMPSRIGLEERLVHCAVSEHFVNLYRGKNAPITELWGGMDEVIQAMEPDGEPNELRGTFGPGDCFKVFRHAIELPNGMFLRYNGLHESDEGGYAYMGGFNNSVHKKLYGGKLVENVTQAFARIIIAEQILVTRKFFEVRYGGDRVVTSTHDEGVSRAPATKSGEALDIALRVMQTPPAWAVGMPLNAEGGAARSYGAAK